MAEKKPNNRGINRGNGSLSRVAIDERKNRFIEAYLQNGMNALQAAIAAGFSEKSAGSAGHRLLKNAQVQQILASRRKEIRENLEISTDRVLQERARLAFSDVRQMFDEHGQVRACRTMLRRRPMRLSRTSRPNP